MEILQKEGKFKTKFINGCGFLLTVGSFLLTIDLFYLQSTI